MATHPQCGPAATTPSGCQRWCSTTRWRTWCSWSSCIERGPSCVGSPTTTDNANRYPVPSFHILGHILPLLCLLNCFSRCACCSALFISPYKCSLLESERTTLLLSKHSRQEGKHQAHSSTHGHQLAQAPHCYSRSLLRRGAHMGQAPLRSRPWLSQRCRLARPRVPVVCGAARPATCAGRGQVGRSGKPDDGVGLQYTCHPFQEPNPPCLLVHHLGPLLSHWHWWQRRLGGSGGGRRRSGAAGWCWSRAPAAGHAASSDIYQVLRHSHKLLPGGKRHERCADVSGKTWVANCTRYEAVGSSVCGHQALKRGFRVSTWHKEKSPSAKTKHCRVISSNACRSRCRWAKVNGVRRCWYSLPAHVDGRLTAHADSI